jgi:hypothetical protein
MAWKEKKNNKLNLTIFARTILHKNPFVPYKYVKKNIKLKKVTEVAIELSNSFFSFLQA